jgi:hypothetical protein
MALIGDVIMGFREQATDLPVAQLAAPGNEVTIVLAGAAGVTLPAGNYRAQLAYRNNWGETLPAAEVGTFAVDGTHGLQVTGVFPPGVVAIVVYLTPAGGASGTENQVFVSVSLPFLITAPSGNPGFPALRNTAWLPDADGRQLSVFTAYRWLNEGLKEAAAYCGGGLPDITGVPSIVQQGMYDLLGQWWRLERFWYDGYPGAMTGSDAIFRKNPVTGNYAMSAAVEHVADKMSVELWPQPARTAGITTTTAQLSLTGKTVALTSNPFTLAFGFALLSDNLGNTEIVAYNPMTGNNLNMPSRGLGGTVQRVWPIGTNVQELNVLFKGLRVISAYPVGSAYATLNVPPGWEGPMVKFLLHRFRDAERNRKDATALHGEFEKGIAALPLNRPVGGPRQIQIGGARGVETYPGLGSFFGGVIVP